MAQKTAANYRSWNQDISGSLQVTTATDDTTLVTVRTTGHTIYIQKVIFYCITDAAQNIILSDSAGTPIELYKVTTSPGAATRWEADFGAIGWPLTLGKNFIANMSAVGLAGNLVWEGYQRLTTPAAIATTN